MAGREKWDMSSWWLEGTGAWSRGRRAYNDHLEDEMQIVRIVLEKVPCDADDNGGAGPHHKVGAASEGLQGDVQGTDVNHFPEYGNVDEITIVKVSELISREALR